MTYGNSKFAPNYKNNKMRYSEAKAGRTFVIRLEDGEILHEEVERFAKDKGINAAKLMIVGGIDKGSKLVVGPRISRAPLIEPMEHIIEDACEVEGFGTIFPNEEGNLISHIHLSAGRREKVVTGCARRGVKVWLVLEVILTELCDCDAKRIRDHNGFELLWP